MDSTRTLKTIAELVDITAESLPGYRYQVRVGSTHLALTR